MRDPRIYFKEILFYIHLGQCIGKCCVQNIIYFVKVSMYEIGWELIPSPHQTSPDGTSATDEALLGKLPIK